MMILMMMMLNSNPLLIISGSHATYCNERIYGKDRRCKWWITFPNGMCVTWLEESHNCADNYMEKGVRFSLSQTKKGTAGLIDQFGSDVIGPLSVKLQGYWLCRLSNVTGAFWSVFLVTVEQSFILIKLSVIKLFVIVNFITCFALINDKIHASVCAEDTHC